MFPGGRGMSPKQMKAAMKRQGIDMDTVDGVEKVVVLTRDKEIVFDRPEVTAITAQGVVTYQVVGNPKERARSAAAPAGGEVSGEELVEAISSAKYSEEDVELVMGQTGASEEAVRAALDECEGEVAEAMIKLIS
ncbi:MAG: nascent polypeptide-associated complex protein [Thermoplasmata archaeon]|nr:nascent polypeptide-associated complex protein [Thermoplasmata archaeon]NIS12766.1 nascent polypeptide-associated complex protein [Thermoplasmata archaeon]NIS19701.1 nascent polypeptide-associated complex protein [Thermoplasmata archaeon]NIT76884.1 nascent polypeptide-associated complex protein [Thermoplasmata archaeon]NIU48812.1 nascent polypeptide-associated complex protein [Thermoplasmata archaeon]